MKELFCPSPEAVTVSGAKYKINTDFKVWIKISSLLTDSGISDFDKLISVLMIGYQEKIPDDYNEAIIALIKFMSKYKTETKVPHKERLIDFETDEWLIYSAFLQQYNIDLHTVSLHWWDFTELLACLSPDTELMRVVGYRAAKPEKIKDKEQRAVMRRLKNKYKIKGIVDEEDIVMALCM